MPEVNSSDQIQSGTKQLNIWLPLLFSLVLVIGMLLGARLTESMGPSPKKKAHNILPVQEPGTLEELVRFIDARYVDDVNVQEISEDAIHHILDQLDPHSTYISAEKVSEVREQLEGSFVGIGIEFLVVDDTITVVKPSKDGPAFNAGILAGDQIITVNDSLIAGQGLETKEFMKLFRGERATQAMVKIKRGKENLDFKITRDEVKLPSLDVAYEIEEGIGFIKLSRFSAETSAEFIQALERLVEQDQVKKLIIDLRDNPGGYLTEAVEILSQLFSEKDKLLVFTEGEKSSRLEYKTTGRPFYQIDEVAVLINENSASASEIIAGAIQDWDRGYIVGRRSFGKGLVQEEYSLRNGSALRLTIARYYTPSGRSIQKNYNNGEDRYNAEYDQRWASGELFFQDSIKQVDSLAFETPSGRLVYAGGGVTPDYFIPLDSIILNENYIALRPFVQEYSFRFFREKKEELNFGSEKEFQKEFQISDETLDDFIAFAKDGGVNKVIDLEQSTKQYFKSHLKSQLAFLKYDYEAQFAEININDEFVLKALQLLREASPIAKQE